LGESLQFKMFLSFIMNKGKSTALRESEIKSCRWCENALTASDYLRELVCMKCYKLFIRAGLTDREIFRPDDSESDKIDLSSLIGILIVGFILLRIF